MERLKKRADFVAAARAVSKARPGLVLQARARGDEARARVGFTATRKIGNAVRRNRARMATKAGRLILARRRAKGRQRLSA